MGAAHSRLSATDPLLKLDLAPAVLLFFRILFSGLSSHLLTPLAPPRLYSSGLPASASFACCHLLLLLRLQARPALPLVPQLNLKQRSPGRPTCK